MDVLPTELRAGQSLTGSAESLAYSGGPYVAGAPRQHDRIVCHCFRITESQLREAIAVGQLETVSQVRRQTCAGGGCTACHRRIKDLLAGHSRPASAEPNDAPVGGSRYLPSASPICIAK